MLFRSLPTSQFFPHSFLNFGKNLSLGFTNDGGEPQVFIVLVILHWTKDIQNVVLAPLRSVGAKEDQGLVSIDFLPRGLFIAIEDVYKLLAFLDTCFAKEKAIVGEEEMSEDRAAPANRNTTYLLVSSGITS